MMKPAKDSMDLGILASDIKASLNFYQNILGLEFVGSPGLVRDHAPAAVRTSDFKLIEPKTVPPKGAVGLEKQLGFRYVTFVIKNLSELCASSRPRDRIRGAGEGSPPGVRIAMVKDRTAISWNSSSAVETLRERGKGRKSPCSRFQSGIG